MDCRHSTPPNLAGLASRLARRSRRERPFLFLIDGRLFRLLCSRGPALAGFQESLVRRRLMPEGGLLDLGMTPLAILDAVGVEPPVYPWFPISKESAGGGALDLSTVLLKMMKDDLGKVPELQAADVRRRVVELRHKTNPAARELFDLCVTRFVASETFAHDLLSHVAFDSHFQFRFPDELREEIDRLRKGLLLDNRESVSGATKVRLLKVIWDGSYQRLLRKLPAARGEIQTVDQQMKAASAFKDLLAWEVIHHAILGYAVPRTYPVVAFTLDPEDVLKARCRGYKTAFRIFLDELVREGNPASYRPRLKALKPGWLVPCRDDGTFESAVSTGELPIFY